ncbi:DUF3467 domain-containing protein [Spirochaetota bacterium]
MKDEKKDMKIDVKVEENIASGIFSNFTNISHSTEEFILDFLYINPSPPPGFGKLMSRVILTPSHAKRLLHALNINLGEYEKRFGEIKISKEQVDIGNLQ